MKRWTEEDISIAREMLKNGNNYYEISLILDRNIPSIRNKLNKYGEKYTNYHNCRIVQDCLNCNNTFESKNYHHQKFCSRSCSVTYNNKLKNKTEFTKKCIKCENKIPDNKEYCSNECRIQINRDNRFEQIKNGDETLNFRAYKKFLIFTYGNKCMNCGWGEKNETTNKVPIHLEHIDGNHKNNTLDNLKLLCPNCHSLTSTYGFLNKGNGRNERQRYRNSLKKKTMEELIDEYKKID